MRFHIVKRDSCHFWKKLCLYLAAVAAALVLVLADGIIFILLTITGLRRKIFDAIPAAVRMAIPAGIGLFIAFLGLQNAGLVVDSSTLVGKAGGGHRWTERSAQGAEVHRQKSESACHPGAHGARHGGQSGQCTPGIL